MVRMYCAAFMNISFLKVVKIFTVPGMVNFLWHRPDDVQLCVAGNIASLGNGLGHGSTACGWLVHADDLVA